MDQKAIEADIKNYKIREGALFKRSKFLKEWRQRWLVLTTNYLYTFTTKNKDELTDVIDLKQIKSYKSYLRKDQEMIPAGIKIRTAEDMYYLCAKNCNEKWSWIVSFERLMDYKYTGTSNYNNADWIRTKGFDSQSDFESGKTKVEVVQDKEKSSEESKKQVNDEADSIIKQLQQQQKQLEKMKQELEKKEATFILEQRKIQQEKVKLQQQQKDLLTKQEVQKVVESPKKPQPVVKKQEPPKLPEKVQTTTSRVSELRNMYEKKTEGTSNVSSTPKTLTKQESKQQKKQDMSIVRSSIVNSLFNQFRTQNIGNNSIRYVTEFLINVSADETSGYSPYVIIQGKSNQNNKNFGEVVTQLIGLFTDFQKCENLMKFIEICIFQMPIIFTAEQNVRTQNKLKQIFLNLNNDEKLHLVIKNMFILNKIKRYPKNDIYSRLQKLSKESKNEQTRNWAAKLRDDL